MLPTLSLCAVVLAGSGCKRDEDPGAIRSDKVMPAPSATPAVSTAAPVPSATDSTLAPKLSASEEALLMQLSAPDTDAGLGLKIGTSGGGVGPGAGGGLESLGGGTGADAGSKSASAVIAGHRFRFRACYTKELAKDPKAGGKVMVKVEVAPNGDVKSAKATSSTASKDLTDCVVRAFDFMQFAASDAGTTTTLDVPIVLTGEK